MFAEEDCEDVVEVGQWEDFEDEPYDLVRAKVLRLSTDWIEHRDAHGLEKHEPSRNVEIVHLREYSLEDDVSRLTLPSVCVSQPCCAAERSSAICPGGCPVAVPRVGKGPSSSPVAERTARKSLVISRIAAFHCHGSRPHSS